MLSSKCVTCDSNKSKFIKEQEAIAFVYVLKLVKYTLLNAVYNLVD